MTRVAIIHSYWDALGGAERLAQETIQALNSRDIIPDLYTMRNIERLDIVNTFGKKSSFNQRTLSVLDFRLPKFVLYQMMLHTLLTGLLIPSYELVLNTTGPPVFSPLERRVGRQVVYVHTPFPNMFAMRSAPIYYWPFMSYMIGSVNRLRASSKTIFLCNSNFTRERLRRKWNVNATRVYPPVDLDRFRNTGYGPRSGVVTVGRFVREKNHLEQLALAKRLPSVIFNICGTAKKQISMRWLNIIKEHARNLPNVDLHVNIPLSQLRTIICSSKVFLHTMMNEDFGIAPVEAIMGGCIPIVADNGGCKETVPYEELRFNSLDDAQEKVEQALNSKFDHLLPKLQEYAATNFSQERFRTQLLEQILEH